MLFILILLLLLLQQCVYSRNCLLQYLIGHRVVDSYEPISIWSKFCTIIETDIVSKYALDCQVYNTSNTSITWENCSLRKWLNETFLSQSFSPEEQAQIIQTTVSADQTGYGTDSGNNTSDKLFLLSAKEIALYRGTAVSSWKCFVTEYAQAQAVAASRFYVGKIEDAHSWWLRTAGKYQNFAMIVGSDGYDMPGANADNELLFVLVSAISIGYALFDQSFIYYLQIRLHVPVSMSGVVRAVIGAIAILVNFTITMALVQRFNSAKAIIPITLLCAAASGCAAFTGTEAAFIIAGGLFYASINVLLAFQNKIFGDFAAKGNSELLSSCNYTVDCFASAAGSLAAGFIYNIGPLLPYAGAAILYLCIPAVAVMIRRRAYSS